jgi:hypothetical protein
VNCREFLVLQITRRRAVRDAVLAAFEPAPADTTARVRRQEVVDEVARALGVRVVQRALHEAVRAVVEDLGAVPINPHNQRWYRGLRRRQGGPGVDGRR